MIPVKQTVTTVPGGNCFSACIASILEMDIEDVPYFMGDLEQIEDPEFDWFTGFLSWLFGKGYWAIPLPLNNAWRPDGLYILSGKSPRGDYDHSVVASGTELTIVHDPHPDNTGILTHDDVVVIVPLDPIQELEP